MADGTRSQDLKRLEDSFRILKEQQVNSAKETEEIKNTLVEIKEFMAAVTFKYDQVAAHVYGKQHESVHGVPENLGLSSNQFRAESSQSQPFPEFGTRYAKIDFPKFFGDNPSGWVYKCERFFEYNCVEDNNKVKLAILHLEDRALQWYQWFEKTHALVNWDLFKNGLISCFGSDVYEDVVGELTKLKQTSSVRDYQEQFEILANKTQGLPEHFFTSCFISGLKKEIRANVLMFKPTNTMQAIGLAKLQELSIEAVTQKTRLPLGTGENFSYGPSRPNFFPTIRRELPKELEEKRAKGLCFKCNEKFT